jgi:hypothetical protein
MKTSIANFDKKDQGKVRRQNEGPPWWWPLSPALIGGVLSVDLYEAVWNLERNAS